MSEIVSSSRLKGRRILVTGAGSGMGKSIAELFAKAGAQLVLLDANGEAVQGVASTIGANAIKTDVSDEAEVRAAVREALGKLGGLDGLVNAAGILPIAPLMETTVETWRRTLDVNFFGPLLVSRYAAPELLKNDEATIVNIGSATSIRPSPGFGAYSASKAALLSLTRSYAMELGPKVRANLICPGTIRTPMVQQMFADHPARAENRGSAARRLGEPGEIAQVALFLTSRESSFVNGDALVADGGSLYA